MTAGKEPRKTQALVKSSLGPLEKAVLSVVCTADSPTVREVVRRMDREIAYTTVMTTLDRLYRKGILHRKKVKRAYVYNSALSLPDLEKQTARDLLSAFLQCRLASRELMAATLLEMLDEKEPALVDELLVQLEKRRDGRPKSVAASGDAD